MLFRRYAMKPIPKKPKIIMAQVEGSGTGDTLPISELKRSEYWFALAKFGSIKKNGSK